MADPSPVSSFTPNHYEIEIEAESQTAPPTTAAHRAIQNSSSNYQYDIFLNHRGPDVKKTFASHLYRRLLSCGVQAFLDYQEMQEGEDITSQIKEAIATASVHVAIFSKGYADSHWCLDELLLMLDSVKDSRATIIPVFYNVRPADLRWTKGKAGVYGQSLHILQNKKTCDSETHEEKPRHNSNTIESWRKALSSVAQISGFELEAYNGDEGELLDNLVLCLLDKVKKPVLNVTKYPTALDEKVKDFENTVLLQQPSGKPKFVGIVGLSGVGKSTLAKELFDRKRSYYPKSCFLTDVRENAAKGSLNVLQSKLLKCLIGLDYPIDSTDEGKAMLIKHSSSFSQGFLVLDDVDHMDQLDALLPVDPHYSCLILITSRDRDIFVRLGVQESSIYNLTGLDTQHSRELFCSYAFCQPHPPEGFETLVDKFLGVCHGLPLFLKVVGTLLSGNDSKPDWEVQLNDIQQTLPPEIQKKLKISYDSLSNQEQQIFLEIACFFVGEKRDTAIRLCDGLGCQGSMRFQNLQNKFLVEVDSENCIVMHDYFRKLGRKIAEDSGFFMPRLLRPTQTMKIDDALEQILGNIQVRGIRMVCSAPLPWFKRRLHELCGKQKTLTRNLQFLVAEGDLESLLRRVLIRNLKWLRWYKCAHSSLPCWIPVTNLRVLHVAGSKLKTLWQSKSQAPLQLRELNILAPLSKFPKSIGKLRHLEQIDVRLGDENSVETLPDGFCRLRSLKRLELINAWKLKLLPDSFGNLTKLEHINLSFSHNLERLPDSFSKLSRLKYLDLRESYNLTITAETLVKNSPLKFLDLSKSDSQHKPESKTGACLPSWLHWRNFKVTPPRWTYARSKLSYPLGLKPYGQDMAMHSCSLGTAMRWRLRRRWRRRPDPAAESCSSDATMEAMGPWPDLALSTPPPDPDSESCSSDATIEAMGSWPDRASAPAVKSWPDPASAPAAESRPEMGPWPDPASAPAAESRPKMGPWPDPASAPAAESRLEDMEPARWEDMSAAVWEDMKSAAESEDMEKAESEDMESAAVWEDMKSAAESEDMEKAEWEDMESAAESEDMEPAEVYPPLRQSLSLEELHITELPSSMENLINLEVLELRSSSFEMLPPSLTELSNLKELRLVDCLKLNSLRDSVGLLTELVVHGCHGLLKVETLPNTLMQLELTDCEGLRKIEGLSGLAKLLKLNITGCPEVQELPGIETLVSLDEFRLRDLNLKRISGLAQLTKLRLLDVSGCSKIEELEGVEHLRSLEKLDATGCSNLHWDRRVLEQLHQVLEEGMLII